MEKQMRFVVMGDMHYVQPECHKKALGGQPNGVTELDDIKRNFWMTQNVLPDIISSIAAQEPDFIVQTGDFIQGHCDNEDASMRETDEALNLLVSLNIPTFFAMGTHDGIPGTLEGVSVEKLIYPTISRFLGEPLSKGYYKFVKEHSLFVVLDYTTFLKNDEQAVFIQETLSKSGEYEHVFIFAHPPLIPIGRPFFSNYDFAIKVKETVEQYPIDGYFCGHTHNQVASIHKLGQNWIPQLKSSVLGYPNELPVRITDVRPLLPDPSTFELGWGFLEDSAPGWWIVTVNGSKVKADWCVLNNEVQGEITWNRGEKPIFIQRPIFKSIQPAEVIEVNHIRSARIRVAGSNCKSTALYEVYLNEHLVGYLPRLEYFDCRQFLNIDSFLWPFLNTSNILRVTTSDELICLGGFVLEIETESGWIHSDVSPFYTNTSRWDIWGVHQLEHIQSRAEIQVNLSFV